MDNRIKWQYCCLWDTGMGIDLAFYTPTGPHHRLITDEFEVVIAKLGLEGWELVSVNPSSDKFFFKRTITVSNN